MNNKEKYYETLKLLKNKINSIQEPNARREFLKIFNDDTEKTIADIEKNNISNPMTADMMWGLALISVEGTIEIIDDYLKGKTR